MNTPIQKTMIHEIPASPYKLTSPLEVHIYQEAGGGFRATAPELGMWVDGLGRTQTEAVEDLADAIMGLQESLRKQAESRCSKYARAIKKTFEQRFIEG
jgi:predicted RNase H-like HicB family nuclease